MISRVLGYLRDFSVAALLGTSDLADAFVIGFRIPNWLRRMVGEGAMSAGFVPVFTDYLTREEREEAIRFAERFFYTLLLVLLVVASLGILLAPWIVRYAFAIGFQDVAAKTEMTVALTRLMFPYIVFVGLAAFAMGFLNTLRVFWVSAAAPVMLNLSIIAAAFLYARNMENPAMGLAYGVLFGGVLQFVFQAPFLWKKGVRFRPAWGFKDPGVRKVGLLILPTLVGAGATQLNLLIDSALASLLEGGSVSALYFANRVNELTLGVTAVSISTVVLPLMSRQAVAKDREGLRSTLGFALRMATFFAVPASVALLVLREPIVRVLFEHGAFQATSTDITTYALAFYTLGLPAYGVVKVTVQSFYAEKDTKTPVKIAALVIPFNFVLNLLLMGPLRHGGIALATALAAYLNAALLLIIRRRRWGRLGLREYLRSALRTLSAAAVMGAALWYALPRIETYSLSGGWVPWVSLMGVVALGGGLYFGAARLIGCSELSELRLMSRKDQEK